MGRHFIFVLLILFFFANFIEAAEVAVDISIHINTASHNGSSPTSVFISDQIGYAFYRDSTGSCVYSKTIDGGGAWGAAVNVDAQTDCVKIAVWYDRWTPGDDTGNYIHISTIDSGSGDIWYTRLDTGTDALTATVNASGALQGGAFTVGANINSITKGTDGDLYMGVQDAEDSFVLKCISGADCAQAINWVEAGLNPFDLANDWLILMPLSGGNIMAIRWDISADDIQSKVYNDTLNAWDLNWTNIDLNAPDNTAYDAAFGAALDKLIGDIYLAYAADNAVLGTDDDIRTAKYSGGSWALKTDVLTNDSKGITGVKIALDENSKDIYALYTGRTSPGTAATGNVYWKRSSDGMVSWGTEQGPINAVAGDLYGARLNIMSNERIYVTWDLPSTNDLMGNTIVDLQIPNIAVGSTGSQTSSVTIPATDAYIGGAFTLNRTQGTADVNLTQLIITDTGTVNANLNLSNVDIYYETAGTCSFDGAETLFGTGASFSVSEKAAVSGALTIGASQICVYVVLDISSGASAGQTVEVEISNPSTEITVSVGTVMPGTAVAISGTTSLTANQPPATPTNTSPANGVIINSTLTPTLSASAFSDTDGDAHAASQWQITTISGNYISPVWDSGSSAPAATSAVVGTTLSNNTTYYWHVRYKDSFGFFSAYSAETSFTISNNPPVTPVNVSPENNGTVVTLTPLLQASDFSDSEGNSHAAAQWQVTNVAGNYALPVFDFTSSSGEISRLISPNTLTNFSTYYWHVRYRDNFGGGNWSAYSSETSFTIAVSSIAVQIQPIAGKTEFFAGDTIPLDVQVINFSTGSPINDATATISIYNPSGAKIVNQQTMTYIAGSNGLYRFNFTIPSVNGVYVYEVKAEKAGQTGFGAANFQTGAFAALSSDVASVKTTVEQSRSSQQKAFSAILSDVDEIQIGKIFRLKVWIQDFENKLVNAFAVPTVAVFDAVRNIVAADSPMTNLSTGIYEFVYTTSAGQTQGLWEAAVTIPLDSANTIYRSDFFQVTGAPAQVKINSITDNTVPSISANVTITNEGTTPFEYQYEYCAVVQSDNQCGGGDDVDYAIAAKLINPGQSFSPDLTLTVPAPGDYYFKTVVYWGTER
jgi:hypothetical protein